MAVMFPQSVAIIRCSFLPATEHGRPKGVRQGRHGPALSGVGIGLRSEAALGSFWRLAPARPPPLPALWTSVTGSSNHPWPLPSGFRTALPGTAALPSFLRP